MVQVVIIYFLLKGRRGQVEGVFFLKMIVVAMSKFGDNK
jgi:hypothetical protein